MLRGKRVLLGVTGSIAAYKACDLVQRLKEQHCEVRVILTPEATRLVQAETFAALTGQAVLVDTWAGVAEGHMDHIAWARWADCLLIAPATAHILGQLAHGLTDNALSLLALAFTGPVLVAPAMNTQMLHHAAVQANLQTLMSRGVVVLPSGEGVLACGEVGEGKLLEVNSLVAHLRTCLAHPISPLPHLKGRKVLLSFGHTQEAIDDVRFLSNRSSGKTGQALARAFWRAGAEVHAVVGPLDTPIAGHYASVTRVLSTEEFHQVLTEKAPAADVVVMAAAISDFLPVHRYSGKTKDSKALSNIELKESPHILKELGNAKPPQQVLVGFALETSELLSEASRKLADRHCDWVVVNNPVASDSGFGRDEVLAGIVGPQGVRLAVQNIDKEVLAAELLLAVEATLADRAAGTGTLQARSSL
jgi:phosphopantothenoylcysteine decarboxylase / phosphopantothenate---cysteine ligase